MEVLHQKLQGLTLLIVEDDTSTLKWLVRVLSIYFKEVRGASDAMEALELFNISPTDIVISDIQIPQVDGIDFLQKISLLSPSTMKVIMTAFNNNAYINRAIESEINFYFKKPIDIDELLFTIASNAHKKEISTSLEDIGNNYFYNHFKKIVINDKKIIDLTKKEILLLELMLKNKHTIVTVTQIENYVWEEEASIDAIRMLVTALRKKLYANVINNIKGVGYKLNI